MVSRDVAGYIMDIVENTRKSDRIRLGVSPRGTLALYRACQAQAAINGREFVIPEDVKKMAPYVLGHRIIVKGSTKETDAAGIIDMIIKQTKAPVEDI